MSFSMQFWSKLTSIATIGKRDLDEARKLDDGKFPESSRIFVMSNKIDWQYD